ncbi:DUF6873 family GME fold protein [Clostridium sp.]|jgi:hypothetical protein|uniref:DUF6873 family GME fold protein n=1 Tax=Clostridium sp. TaxID=1506 RepID=UPI003EEA1526
MKTVIVDFRIHNEEKSHLIFNGYNVLLCPPSNLLDEAVCGHPDMLMYIDENSIIVHKDMDTDFIQTLAALNYKIYKTTASLQSKYPQNVLVNLFCLGNLFVHSINFTDTKLLSLLKSKKFINVKQGYTKCSTCVVTNQAVITSDTSIAKSLFSEKIDVLLIPPGDIILPGMNYGFIGGATGLVENDVLAFYGHLDHYLYGKDVLSFLKKHKVEPMFLRNGKLIDRGSIFRI